MNVDVLWTKFLSRIKDELTSLSYNTWFAETKLYSLNDGKACIIVPMPIHKKLLLENYGDLISSGLNELTGENYELQFLLSEEIEDIKTTPVVEKIPVVENDNTIESNLNDKYTFDTFIVGNSNKFAQAAALSVAENPGKMYNPLFIYGNSGLGKTHLMHAIGNYIVQNSNKRVLYVTSEKFTSDFVLGKYRLHQRFLVIDYLAF